MGTFQFGSETFRADGTLDLESDEEGSDGTGEDEKVRGEEGGGGVRFIVWDWDFRVVSNVGVGSVSGAGGRRGWGGGLWGLVLVGLVGVVGLGVYL